MFKEEQEGQCNWHGVSKKKKGQAGGDEIREQQGARIKLAFSHGKDLGFYFEWWWWWGCVIKHSSYFPEGPVRGLGCL